MAIKAPAIPSIISGLTLIPLVSSSKNLKRPALDAGKGAFFLAFLLIFKNLYNGNKSISVLKKEKTSNQILNYI